MSDDFNLLPTIFAKQSRRLKDKQMYNLIQVRLSHDLTVQVDEIVMEKRKSSGKAVSRNAVITEILENQLAQRSSPLSEQG